MCSLFVRFHLLNYFILCLILEITVSKCLLKEHIIEIRCNVTLIFMSKVEIMKYSSSYFSDSVIKHLDQMHIMEESIFWLLVPEEEESVMGVETHDSKWQTQRSGEKLRAHFFKCKHKGWERELDVEQRSNFSEDPFPAMVYLL